jgi:hypothetical protein
MKELLVLLATVFTLTGCVGGQRKTVIYDINLREVERPADAKQRYGEPKIIRLEEEGKSDYSFEDQMIKIAWLPTASQFSFNLTNKTSRSLKIVWDEAVFVDQTGNSKKIMHNGVKYIDKNSSQPSSVVVRGATISEMIIPTDNVHFTSGQYGGWTVKPIFPNYSNNNGAFHEEITDSIKNVVGKKVQILLPIKNEDVVSEYVFIFSIDGYKIQCSGYSQIEPCR